MSLAAAAVAAAVPGAIPAPSIEYSQLAPMLVVFGAAVVGVLVGTFTRYEVPAVLATVSIILASIYILWMYQRTMNGPTAESVAAMPDLRVRELLAVVPLVALIIAMGVYPKPVLDVINPAVKSTMSQVNATDPVPAHPAAAQKGIQP